VIVTSIDNRGTVIVTLIDNRGTVIVTLIDNRGTVIVTLIDNIRTSLENITFICTSFRVTVRVMMFNVIFNNISVISWR